MKIIYSVILLSLAVVTPALAQGDAPTRGKSGAPATRPTAPTVGARCNLRIGWDGRVPDVEYDQFILEHPATKEAARRLLNIDDLRRVMSVRRYAAPEVPRPDAGLTLYVGGLAKIDGAHPAAAEFVHEIIDALPKQLAAHQGSFVSQEIEAARERLRRAEAEMAQLLRDRADRLQRLRKITGRTDPAENWTQAIANLEEEQQKLKLDLAGQQARRRAIEETIAKITKQAQLQAQEDEIARELEKIVGLRQEEFRSARDLLVQGSGQINQNEVTNIEAKVADARARLLERRELAARAAGGDLLSDFNRELLMLTINAAENEARLALIRDTLNRFQEATADVDRLKLMEKNLATEEAEYLRARANVAAVEERYRNIQAPSVTILDCDYAPVEQPHQDSPNQQ